MLWSMLGPPVGEAGYVDLPEAGAEVGHVRQRARVHQRIVGQRLRSARTQSGPEWRT